MSQMPTAVMNTALEILGFDPKSTKEEMNSLIFINFGLPLVKARELTPYELCRDVNLYNLFSTT